MFLTVRDRHKLPARPLYFPLASLSTSLCVQMKNTRLLDGRKFALVDLVEHRRIGSGLNMVRSVYIVRRFQIDQPQLAE